MIVTELNEVTKLYLLVGGKGTRLSSVTNGTPKPLVDINNNPFLKYVINKFELESQELGKFGRVLGKLHIDRLDGKDLITKTCVNDCLVKEGYAVEYDGGKREKVKVEQDKQDQNEDVPFGD